MNLTNGQERTMQLCVTTIMLTQSDAVHQPDTTPIARKKPHIFGTGDLRMSDLIDKQSVVDIAMCYCPDDDGSCSKADADIRELLDEIENLQAVNRWIPCRERLPNEAGEYLVCGRWDGEKPKTWICKFEIFVDIGGFVNHAKNPPISFWRPMPEPPEKE
jgi:hypothetical protein